MLDRAMRQINLTVSLSESLFEAHLCAIRSKKTSLRVTIKAHHRNHRGKITSQSGQDIVF